MARQLLARRRAPKEGNPYSRGGRADASGKTQRGAIPGSSLVQLTTL